MDCFVKGYFLKICKYSESLSTALGLATTVTDPKNVKNNYVYDIYGRLIKNSFENISEMAYAYGKGNHLGSINPETEETYKNAVKGRMLW